MHSTSSNLADWLERGRNPSAMAIKKAGMIFPQLDGTYRIVFGVGLQWSSRRLPGLRSRRKTCPTPVQVCWSDSDVPMRNGKILEIVPEACLEPH